MSEDVKKLMEEIENLKNDLGIIKIIGNTKLKNLYDVLERNNINFYGFSSEIIDEFCISENGKKLENKYSYLKEHYLLVKEEHDFLDETNYNIIHKYIKNFISPIFLYISSKEIKEWVESINNFSKSSMFSVLHIVVSGDINVNSMVKNYDFLNINEKKEDLDKIMVITNSMTEKEINDFKKEKNYKQKIVEGLSAEYKKMFNEINNEFKKFLENKKDSSSNKYSYII